MTVTAQSVIGLIGAGTEGAALAWLDTISAARKPANMAPEAEGHPV